MKKVLILGGGFAGIESAIELTFFAPMDEPGSRMGAGALVIPLPIIGHWLKKGWGSYARLTKLGKIPRFPGL